MTKEYIPVIVNETATETDVSSMFPTARKAVSKICEIQVSTLSQEVAEIVNRTADIFENIDRGSMSYYVDQVTIALNISNGGKVALIGEASTNITSGITIVLK
ncbi:MAG: hypothetical protein QG670_1347, partial [Thermoproteota archaeon]|nr:hypothetical protein [Thermoproteota archaeon]